MYADEELVFLTMVRQLKGIGYGRMQQIISHEWFRHDPTGAALATTAYGLLQSAERVKYVRLAESDPLFERSRPA